MGRVSRKRKIKAIDPFSKRRREEDARANQPPSRAEQKRARKALRKDEGLLPLNAARRGAAAAGAGAGADPVSKKVRQLVELQKRAKDGVDRRKSKAAEYKARKKHDELVASGEIAATGAGGGGGLAADGSGRKEGESLRAYARRMKAAAAAKIAELGSTGKRISEKRKKYLEARAARRTAKEREEGNWVAKREDAPERRRATAAVEKVAFGERAEAPPNLSVRPRKAGKAGKTGLNLRLAAAAAMQRDDMAAFSAGGAGAGSGEGADAAADADDGDEELRRRRKEMQKAQMEALRARAQASYASLKKRKQQGKGAGGKYSL